jgi:non-ribosomal peptide synthetase component F
MTLLTAFQVMLSRYAGQEEVVVGTVVANRLRRETEELIGFFINTLVLRTDLSGNPRFTKLLRRVREVCLGAYAHQDVPFERLVEELRPERSLNHSPLFQVTFGLNNAPQKAFELPGLELGALEIEDESVRFDLTLWVEEDSRGLRGRWTYRTALFDAETIRRMTAHWETLLRSLVASPDARLQSLEMLTEEEKKLREIEQRVREALSAEKLLTARRKTINVIGGVT